MVSITPDALLALANEPPKDRRQRFALFEAARRLMLAVEEPMNMGYRVHFNARHMFPPSERQCATAAAVSQIAIDLGIFDMLATEPSKAWTATQLAEKAGAESVLIVRIMRNLCHNALATEVANSTYKASHLTGRCASLAFRAGLAHAKNVIWPGLEALPAYLAENEYRNPNDNVKSASMKGLDFNGDVMAYLKANPAKAAASFQFMAENKQESLKWMDAGIPTDDLHLSSHDVEKDRVMLVDVGGSSGHQCVALRKAFPELKGRLVLQDLDFMVDMIDKKYAEEIGFEPMAHDFFKPQAIKGAKVYYMRNVLHDWDDKLCRSILRNTRQAMADDSVLLVDEIVMPSVGANGRQAHMDLAVMVFASAMERTENQWSELLQSEGLKIRNILIYDEQLGAGLIAAVPI